MRGKARAASYLGNDFDWYAESPVTAPAPKAKPEIRALVETAEGGSKVIWLSEGFPVDRSSYGRITLARVARRAGARVCARETDIP